MQAFVIEHLHTAGTVKDISPPQPGPHEIFVRVTAASVNPVDWKTIEHPDRVGKMLPFVAGQDFAGVVEDLGNEVRRFALGDRVFGIAREYGAYAEYTVVPDDERPGPQPVCKISDEVGEADAASLPTAGLTALASLEYLGADEKTTLLIIGATGGVGSFATQLAKLRGARVIGTARSGTEAFAQSLGASDVIAYDREDTIATVKAKYPDGIDAVLDLVNDTDGTKAFASIIRPGGKIVSTIGGVDTAWFGQHRIEGKNLVMNQTPQSSHDGLRALVKLVESGDLKVYIAAERSLSDAAQALELSKSGSVQGKIVITIE